MSQRMQIFLVVAVVLLLAERVVSYGMAFVVNVL